MTKSFSKMENREEVAKQSLSLQILGVQLLVLVRLHNKLLSKVKIRILSHEKCSWTFGLDLLIGQCLIFKIWDSFLWEPKEADKK